MSNQIDFIAMNGEKILEHCKENPNEKFVVTLRCSTCGEIINDTSPMKGADINKNWTSMMLTAPLQTRKCSRGHGSYSDCNMHFNTYLYPPIVDKGGYGDIPSSLEGKSYQIKEGE